MTRALRRRMLVAVALLAAGLACLIELGGVLERLEQNSVDTRFELRGEQPAPSDTIIVGVDDKTFDDLEQRWPFPRKRFAEVLENVSAGDPAVIVYDVQFTEQSDDPRGDNRLIEASRAAGNVVFSTTEVGDNGESKVFGGGEGLRYARARSGNGLLPEDAGGVLRRLPEQVDGLDTLAVAAVRRLGRPVPELAGRGAWIDFGGPGGHLPHVSFSDVAARGSPGFALPRQDRRDRRHGAGAPGFARGLVARRQDGRAGDPRERDPDAAARRPARGDGTCAEPADRPRARAAGAAARARDAAVDRPVDRAGRRARLRRRRATALQRRLDRAGRRAARRGWRSASSARCSCTG